jgi:hypothetical protein
VSSWCEYEDFEESARRAISLPRCDNPVRACSQYQIL